MFQFGIFDDCNNPNEVTLEVFDTNNCSQSLTISNLNAHCLPEPAITANDICDSDPFAWFSASNNNNIPIVNWVWDFGDNQGLSTASPFIPHPYFSSGQYNITVAVEDIEGCIGVHYDQGQVVPHHYIPKHRESHCP